MNRLARTLVGTWMALALVTTGTAAPPAGATSAANEDNLAVLEAIYAAQQKRLGELERQVAAVVQDADAARIAAMKRQIREVLSDAEFRESLVPTTTQVGYDKGFYIKTTDDRFSLRVSWIAQFRWTHYGTGSRNRYLTPRLERDDRTGFDFARLRLRFYGHAWDPDLTYFFSFTHAANTRYDVRPIYAWLNYRFCDAFQVSVGEMRLASTRAQTSAITRYQLVELPFSDAVFGAGVGLGVRMWGRLFDRRITWYLDVVNAMNSPANRTITNDPAELDNSPAILLRVIWHALGDNPGKEFPNQSDTAFHESPALDLGVHYWFDDDEGTAFTSRIPFANPNRQWGQGAFGLTNSNGMQVHTVGYEAAFQYRGFAAVSEFHVRFLDPRRAGRRPFTPWWLMTREGDTTSFYGGYLQMGYFLPIPGLERKLEIAARVEGVGGIDPGNQGSWMYTAGVNYFIHGEKVKLQADISKIEESPISSGTYGIANVNDKAILARVQLQVAF